nr:LruC domain-containing protein [Cytophagales bacterium]
MLTNSLKYTAMKRLIILLLVSFLSIAVGYSQNVVTAYAEEGSRNFYFSQCWSMGAFTVSNGVNTRIEGSFSFRSNQLTSESNRASWITSPWMLLEEGSISFLTRLDGFPGTTRAILIQYIPFDPTDVVHGHGESVTFHTFSFPDPIRQTTVHEVTARIPEEIIGKPHKIFISFIGTGGTARAGVDNISIPGTYYADPSNGCRSLAEMQADSDGDGVVDEEDDYPDDQYRAFNNYFPAKDYSTLMFEDLWPSLGDYDFNDLVVDYKINRVTDASGEIVEVIADLRTRAAGAGYRNGFGIEFTGIDPSKVISVEGTRIKGETIHRFDERGLEADTRYLTVIAFDDVYNVLPHAGQGSTGVNTTAEGPFQEVSTLRVIIRFKVDGVTATGGEVLLREISHENFNPFLIANQRRGYEVHLPGKQSTALADHSLFGSSDDNSVRGSRQTYRSKQGNLPWAMDIAENIPYLKEGQHFTRGFMKFKDWVKTDGNEFIDWYLERPGYRNGEALLNIR